MFVLKLSGIQRILLGNYVFIKGRLGRLIQIGKS